MYLSCLVGNMVKFALRRQESLIFIKLGTAERSYVKICYTEFHPNPPKYMESTGRNLLMSLSKV
jgi:hypothetical protein